MAGLQLMANVDMHTFGLNSANKYCFVWTVMVTWWSCVRYLVHQQNWNL